MSESKSTLSYKSLLSAKLCVQFSLGVGRSTKETLAMYSILNSLSNKNNSLTLKWEELIKYGKYNPKVSLLHHKNFFKVIFIYIFAYLYEL